MAAFDYGQDNTDAIVEDFLTDERVEETLTRPYNEMTTKTEALIYLALLGASVCEYHQYSYSQQGLAKAVAKRIEEVSKS